MDDRLPEALEWLGKAVGDSDAARILIREKGPIIAIGFHMQQAVEKALKGLLTLRNIRFPRTHDLDVLANMAMAFLPSLSQFPALCAQLNEFAVVTRYPGDTPEVSHRELEEWFKEMEVLLHEIESVLHREQEKPHEGGNG